MGWSDVMSEGASMSRDPAGSNAEPYPNVPWDRYFRGGVDLLWIPEAQVYDAITCLSIV